MTWKTKKDCVKNMVFIAIGIAGCLYEIIVNFPDNLPIKQLFM